MSEKFGFEIDFLPVGDSSQSGDTICLRLGYNLSDRAHRHQTVVVVDGGFADDGEKKVNHIRKWYDTNYVDVKTLTHRGQGALALPEKEDKHHLIGRANRPADNSGSKQPENVQTQGTAW